MGDQEERNRTVYISGLNHRVTKEHIYELFVQAGPIEKAVLIEKDAQKGGAGEKKEGAQRGFTFALVTYKDSESVPFAIAILNGIELYGQPINIKPREGSDHGSAIEDTLRLLHGAPEAVNLTRNNPQQQLPWSRTHPMDVRGMMGPPGGTPYTSPLAGMFEYTPPPPPPFHPAPGRQHSYPLMPPRRDRDESWQDRGYDDRYGNNGGRGDFRHSDRDIRGGGRDQQQQWGGRRDERHHDDRDYRRRDNRGGGEDRYEPPGGPSYRNRRGQR